MEDFIKKSLKFELLVTYFDGKDVFRCKKQAKRKKNSFSYF